MQGEGERMRGRESGQNLECMLDEEDGHRKEGRP